MPTRMNIEGQAVGEDGWGIATYEGEEVRVFDLLPGEEALVEVEHRSRNTGVSWARIKERTGELSPSRVEPLCPAYGKCGGCAWQHMDIETQREHKRRRVEAALASSLSHVPEIAAPLASSQVTGYRNKGKYVFGVSRGQVVLGAYRPRSHDVISTLGCKVVEPAIDVLAQLVRDEVERRSIAIYVEKISETGLRYAIIRSNGLGQTLAVLVCTSDTNFQSVQRVADALIKSPGVVGVIRCDNDLKSGALLTDKQRFLCGTELAEEVAEVKIGLDGEAFYQLNREQASRAYQDLATAIGAPGTSPIIELYCGVGGIAFTLARAGHRVLGFELDPGAVARANRAAQRAHLQDLVSFEVGDASRLSADVFSDVETVVVDPPRKGLGKATLSTLCTALPACIAYLSCGPESLAADLAVLVQSGYRIESVTLYDFMPGTAQVETLVVLRQ